MMCGTAGLMRCQAAARVEPATAQSSGAPSTKIVLSPSVTTHFMRKPYIY